MLSPRLVLESYYGVCGMSNKGRSGWDRGLHPDVILSVVDGTQIPVDCTSAATGGDLCGMVLSAPSIHLFGALRIRDHAWAGSRFGKAGPQEERWARCVPTRGCLASTAHNRASRS